MQLPNVRIMLISAIVFAILVYVSILISGGGLKKDHFADLGKKQNTFTLYYMNGCPHCESILPEYKTFMANGQFSSNGKTTKIRMLEQGDPAAAPELEAHNVTGFPTFYMTTANGKDIEYKGERNVSAIKGFISQNAS